MWRLWRAIPIALVAGQISGFAAAQPAVGTAVSVVPAASNVRGGTARTLAIADAIEQNDRIQTGPSGATRIRFRDDTILTISANADLEIDRSVFDGSAARNLTIDLAKGALRFVSGVSPQRSYEIRTPTATIGVRGTIVQVLATKDRVVADSLESEVVVCQRGIPLPAPGLSSPGCRELRAGEPALAVTPGGFSRATAQEVTRLSRLLDGAHFALDRRIGADPTGYVDALFLERTTGTTGFAAVGPFASPLLTGGIPNFFAGDVVRNPLIRPTPPPPPPPPPSSGAGGGGGGGGGD